MTGSLGMRRLGMAVGVALVLTLAGIAWRWFEPSLPVQPMQAREMVHTVVATATVQTQHRASSGVQILSLIHI